MVLVWDSFTKPPFKVTAAEVAIICPGIYHKPKLFEWPPFLTLQGPVGDFPQKAGWIRLTDRSQTKPALPVDGNQKSTEVSPLEVGS